MTFVDNTKTATKFAATLTKHPKDYMYYLSIDSVMVRVFASEAGGAGSKYLC